MNNINLCTIYHYKKKIIISLYLKKSIFNTNIKNKINLLFTLTITISFLLITITFSTIYITNSYVNHTLFSLCLFLKINNLLFLLEGEK